MVLGKAYVTQGIEDATRLGRGPGPVAHTGWPDRPEAMPRLSRTALRGRTPPRFARCSSEQVPRLLPVFDSVVRLAESASATPPPRRHRALGKPAGILRAPQPSSVPAKLMGCGARLDAHF